MGKIEIFFVSEAVTLVPLGLRSHHDSVLILGLLLGLDKVRLSEGVLISRVSDFY